MSTVQGMVLALGMRVTTPWATCNPKEITARS